MKYLLFVSFALCLLAGCSHKVVPVSGHTPNIQFWQPHLRDSVQKNTYRIIFSTGKLSISGIWIIKYMDNSWRGAMLNEFQMKMFDFICTPCACELKNVVAMMDKWYIKKTIAEDLLFILEIDHPKCSMNGNSIMQNDTLTITYKKKTLQRFASGEMVMHNKKRNLRYSFKKMDN